MGNIKFYLSIMLLPILLLAVSCKSAPKTTETRPEEDSTEWAYIQTEQTEQTAQNETKPEFNPYQVSEEYYASTKEDVQHFIEELNQIIQRRDYKAWKAALSDEYFNELSSPENLKIMSEQPAMKTRKITLKNARDYFTNVVVPSRANSRVDDIEFISENRVKAFTIMINRSGDEQRLRLYDLEKNGNIWKIIN
jgi:hypothetical protein